MSPEQQQALELAKLNDTIIEATAELIKFLKGQTTKTKVVNQFKAVGTPDIKYVVRSVNELHKTIKKHENTDLTGITEVMQAVLEEMQLIPKEHAETVEPIDYSESFKALADAIDAVNENLKQQKPSEVHVPAPVVKVTTELKPLLDKMTEGIKAQADLVKDGALQVQTTNGLVTEKFDEYKVTWATDDSGFYDNPEKLATGTTFLFKGKAVAKVKYSYDTTGNITGAKRVKI